MAASARVLAASDLRAGLVAEFDAEVTAESVGQFAAVSGDHNPLHLDEAYARTTNYQGPIVHGAYQVGLASAMAGMYLPGRNALVASINSRFPQPLYYPCTVRVSGELTSWNPESELGSVRVQVKDIKNGIVTADIGVGFMLHEQREHAVAAPAPASVVGAIEGLERPIVVVTGAGGGLGSALVRALSDTYAVVALTNRAPLPDDLRALPNVRECRVDLSSPTLDDTVWEAVAGRGIYGLVHAAWPGVPSGSLLDTPDDVIVQQVLFGSAVTIRLARMMAARVAEGGGRFIVLSSIVGDMRPVLSLSAYSLGKHTLEHAVRLLAPELARKGVTLNALAPSFIPVGVHRQATDRQVMREVAGIPMGRLCSAEDVVGACRYLLSPEASFVSGQVLGLTGAQL